MIYFITIHWKSERWILLQHEMIKKYTTGAYRCYGFLNGVDSEFHRYFDVVRTDADDPGHDVKLDRLAAQVLEDSEDDKDWMVFIDGDAFPTSPWEEQMVRYLEDHALVAIQRLENEGEQHAHPSFCVTTTGFWRKYRPSWRMGYTWQMPDGRHVTDVGGELLRVLRENNIRWKPLYRSNTRNPHPLLFGTYGDLVYHHGTGFRTGEMVMTEYTEYGDQLKRWDGRLLLRIVPAKWKQKIRHSMLHPEGRIRRRLSRRNTALSNEIYARLVEDADALITSLKE